MTKSNEAKRSVLIPRGCFSCGRIFPVQDGLGLKVRGRSFAFDPERGRLWIVCTGCRSWMLVPIEDRWELLEELEERASAVGRVVGATDHVSLILLDGLEVVRIGAAPVEEKAFWRYGRRLVRRHVLRTKVHGRALAWERVAHLITIGLPPSPGLSDASKGFIRWWQLGVFVWVGERRCSGCGSELSKIRLSRSRGLRLRLDADGSLEVGLSCRKCGDMEGGDTSLRGVEAEHVLRKVLAYQNFYGATRAGAEAAVSRVDEAGSSQRYLQQVGEQGTVLAELSPLSRVALEIALDDQVEQSLRRLELQALEERWLEEERLARIVDRELS